MVRSIGLDGKDHFPQSRLSWIDILRGIGIIFIAYGHICNNYVIRNWVDTFQIPLFFFAGGAVYRQKQIVLDIKRRIQTIVIPYFSFGFPILIYWQIIERHFRPSDIGFARSLFGLLSGQYAYLDFHSHLWFLPCYFVTVVAFNTFVNFRGRNFAYGMSFLMSVISLLAPLPGLPWGIDRMFRYIGFYAIGTLSADRRAGERVTAHKAVYSVVGFFFLAANFILAYLRYTGGVFFFTTALIGVAAIAIASLIIGRNGILQYLGRISLLILCVHGPVYRVLIKLVSMMIHISMDALRADFILSMLILIITMAICCLIYKILVRFLPWTLGRT